MYTNHPKNMVKFCQGCQIEKTITVPKRVNEEQILRLDLKKNYVW